MKLSEMARKAKEKLIGAFSGKPKEENSRETAEMDAQKAQEGQQKAKTDISAQNDGNGQETEKNEVTGAIIGVDLANGKDMTEYAGINKADPAAQIEAVIAAGEMLEKAFETLAEELGTAFAPAVKIIEEALSKIGKTETQIRKEELWKRYYEEKAKMSNNERRRRGIPMVRRPKRQQYREKKQKKEGSGNKSAETDQGEDQEEGSGQQDSG